MSEYSATKTFRAHLVSAGAHCQRVEDKLTAGIPDMNVSLDRIDFWVEGKFLKNTPARLNTIIRMGKRGERRLANQRNWLERRKKAGGLCFWWLRVEAGSHAGWYLFDTLQSFDWLRDGFTQQQLGDWPKGFPTVAGMVRHIQEVLVVEHKAGL